jgi:serine/threonine protein kinase
MTPFYASIEQLNEEDAHPSFDIWALGIILYALMAKKEPFTQHSVSKRIKAIENNQREKLSELYSQNLRDLVDYCLTLD